MNMHNEKISRIVKKRLPERNPRIFSFCCICFSSTPDGTRSKKDEVIEYALELAGITDRSQCVMIGDREHDIIGAKKTSLSSLGVLYGYGDRAELEAAGADIIAEGTAELRNILL